MGAGAVGAGGGRLPPQLELFLTINPMALTGKKRPGNTRLPPPHLKFVPAPLIIYKESR